MSDTAKKDRVVEADHRASRSIEVSRSRRGFASMSYTWITFAFVHKIF
jgi:hypothetical protein